MRVWLSIFDLKGNGLTVWLAFCPMSDALGWSVSDKLIKMMIPDQWIDSKICEVAQIAQGDAIISFILIPAHRIDAIITCGTIENGTELTIHKSAPKI